MPDWRERLERMVYDANFALEHAVVGTPFVKNPRQEFVDEVLRIIERISDGYEVLAVAVESIFEHSDRRTDSEWKEHYPELWEAMEHLRGGGVNG